MGKKALIVYGGAPGHEPDLVAALYSRTLETEGFEVEKSDSLDAFLDTDKLMAAVESGVGLAGCHGGKCDAFRKSA